MFFGIAREDYAVSRWRAALPYFLLFWLGGSCISLLFTWFVRANLQNLEIRETELLVTTFLNEKALSEIYRDATGRQSRDHLYGLAFIRLIHGQDHLLQIQDTKGHGLDFQDLVELGPEKSGVWLMLKRSKGHSVLTVISRKLVGGVLLQVGKDARATRDIFEQFLDTVWIGGIGGFFFSWILALLCVKLSFLPLKRLRDVFVAIELNPAGYQLPENGNTPELDCLFQQIDHLAQRNRNLVVEMQSSLDNVAHDLRTPMTRLRSVAEYGLQAVDDTERLREALSDCLEESERVLAMLRIMMTMAEAESGTMHLELELCEVEDSLEDIVELYAYVAEEKNIQVRMHLQPGLKIRADRTRIAQVWGNILDNAIKYGREGGWVEIRSTCEGALQIDFQDNGMGISQNEIGRIWERLYRGDRSRSQQGLGLGLNYVKAVVLAHGGEVRVKSTLHQGSCFSVYLPPAS